MSGDFNDGLFKRVEEIEDMIDELTDQFKKNQIERCSNGIVDASDTVYYSQIMTDIERVGDHILNISQEFTKYNYKLLD